MRSSDSIVALSSAVGRSGVAVIRVSGPKTRFVLETISGKVGHARVVRLCKLRSRLSGDILDQSVVLYFPAPASFTGEDVAEFHVHGSRAVIASVIDEIISLAPDIRLAEAGEFARRAFENGKMDLASIEGLADLIDSETEWQRRQALRLMQGELGQAALAWRERLIMSLAYLDAEIDFMDEGDVGSGWTETALQGVKETAQEISEILATAKAGERVRDGLEVVIIGPPNAGKSSLLNAISKRDVAIVTEFAGTTRDLIEVRCDLDGLPVTFIDTAGMRDSVDKIELEGIRRAFERVKTADLVLSLNVIDSEAVPFLTLPVEIIEVATKSDLAVSRDRSGMLISTVTGEGIPELIDEMTKRLKAMLGEEPALVSRARQREALKAAHARLESAITKSKQKGDASVELIAEDVRLAVRALEKLIGKVDVDDVLDRIFGRFCIGK